LKICRSWSKACWVVKIVYPKSVKDIPGERSKELEEELTHFLKFSPCERLRFVEKEWLELQDYINRFGAKWNRKSS
jgi:hypothetical protein